MSDFDYKKYLNKNPLLEKMTDEEREDKFQQAIRGGGKEEPLRKLVALGKKMDDEYEKTLDPDYDKADEDEDAYERRLGLEEQLNPEVQRTVNNLIKAMAKKYGYEEKDAVFAIQAALKQREFDNK